MRLSRVGWGLVAAAAGGLAWAAVAALESRLLGTTTPRGHLVAAGAIAGAVLWLADRFGMLTTPYTGHMLGLRDDEESAGPEVPLLRLAPTTRVDKRRDVIADFMRRVMNVDAGSCFLSDESMPSDFYLDDSNREWVDRTRQVYGVDISDVDPPYLWKIAERIHLGDHGNTQV